MRVKGVYSPHSAQRLLLTLISLILANKVPLRERTIKQNDHEYTYTKKPFILF